MSNTSNFREAIQRAKQNALVGPNVISNALPIVGVGLVLTALGAWGGLGVIQQAPQIFMSTFIVAIIAQIALFFVAQSVANKGNNAVALPLLATFSLLTGYTLSGLIQQAMVTPSVGIEGIEIAALSCGITFIAARSIGSKLSEEDGMALTKTISLGIIALVGVMVLELVLGFFGVVEPGFLEVGISGIGVLLFAGAAVVDFFILPRTYEDDQYIPAALSMYLTYINLFIFILRFMIAINSRD